MTDIVDRQTRSRMMSGIRSKNTKPEMIVRRFLHAKGLRYKLHDKTLPGRPDIVLSRHRTVIMVQGCFWHRHAGCQFAYVPKTRQDFWMTKLEGNVERDSRAVSALQKAGWKCLTVWECELRGQETAEVLKSLYNAVLGRP